jgi:hypothetical protein
MLQRNVSRQPIRDKACGAVMTSSGSGLARQRAGKRGNHPPVIDHESGDSMRPAADAEM